MYAKESATRRDITKQSIEDDDHTRQPSGRDLPQRGIERGVAVTSA